MRERILIADDDRCVLRALQRLLEIEGFEVLVASNGTEAWEILEQPDAPSFAVLDRMMPGFSGTELCSMVRARKRALYTYLILLTAQTDRDAVVQGLRAGADDYITKPFSIRELTERVRAGMRILAVQRKLHENATHDALTSLLNRRAILERLDMELIRSQRSGQHVGIAIADVDDFKRINDECGHTVGDHVLSLASAIMCENVRPYDEVGRYGGEEFLFVFPQCDTPGAATIAERVRASIAGSVRIHDICPNATVSIGIASTDESGFDAQALIDAADRNLYRAKRSGKNRVSSQIPATPAE